MNHFEELRRAAFERGRRDYARALEESNATGAPLFLNNPHQNNHATDEKEYWVEGWEAERAENGEPNNLVAEIQTNHGWPFPMVTGRIPA